MTKRRFGKWVAYVSTFAVLVVGISPSTFNIPILMRPWVFLASIIWVVVFSSGVLNS
jgi:hypothetical protein